MQSLKINSQVKKTIKEISLFTGRKEEDVREILTALFIFSAMDYEEGRDTYIPFLGSVHIENKGFQVVENQKSEAKLEATFSPDENLIKYVGQVTQKERNIVEDILQQEIQENLERIATNS